MLEISSTHDSLENTKVNFGSTGGIEDEAKLTKLQKEQTEELRELKEHLAKNTEVDFHKSIIKNAEFNADVRKKFNRYKRQIRAKLL